MLDDFGVKDTLFLMLVVATVVLGCRMVNRFQPLLYGNSLDGNKRVADYIGFFVFLFAWTLLYIVYV